VVSNASLVIIVPKVALIKFLALQELIAANKVTHNLVIAKLAQRVTTVRVVVYHNQLASVIRITTAPWEVNLQKQ